MLTCNFYYLIVLFVVRRKAVEIILTIAFFPINQTSTCTAENLNFIGGIVSSSLIHNSGERKLFIIISWAKQCTNTL